MSKLNLTSALVLVAGGISGLGFQAWGQAGILLVLGVLTLFTEVRAHGRHVSQAKQRLHASEIGRARTEGAASQLAMMHVSGGR